MKKPPFKLPKSSKLERQFALKWRAIGGPALVAEFRFDPIRKWRFDLAHPASKTAIEFEGGLWMRGRHLQPQGYENDCEKYNAALLADWSVFRLTENLIVGWVLITALKDYMATYDTRPSIPLVLSPTPTPCDQTHLPAFARPH